MRKTIAGLAVALAVAASAAPAAACGYSGCSSPSWNYNYSGFYGNYSAPVRRVNRVRRLLPRRMVPLLGLQPPAVSGTALCDAAASYMSAGLTYRPGRARAGADLGARGERLVRLARPPTAPRTIPMAVARTATTTHYYDSMPAAVIPATRVTRTSRAYSYQVMRMPRQSISILCAADVSYAQPYRRMIAPRYYPSVRYGYAPRYRHYVGVRRYAMPPRA